MNYKPKVSIVIVSWNVATALDNCLKSIIDTEYPNLEIFVIDNASTDNSSKIIQKYPQVKFIQNTQNLGFPKAINIGLRQAKGEYLLVLNPDTIISRSFLPQSIEFLKNHPDCGVMGPEFLNLDGTTQGSVFPEPSIINAFKEFWLDKKGLTQKYSPLETSIV